MKTYISLLRGINVGGNKMIAMAELKTVYEKLGFKNVRTYLQSGNVLFESASGDASAIEKAIEKKFGHDVTVLLREPADLKRIIESNPFLKKKADPSMLHVSFLSLPISKLTVTNLVVPSGESVEFLPGKEELFLYYPNGMGKSKFTNALLEKKLNARATTRNWNTVNALFRLANG
jgi:uncharacterized protein (DUF1697 family)